MRRFLVTAGFESTVTGRYEEDTNDCSPPSDKSENDVTSQHHMQ